MFRFLILGLALSVTAAGADVPEIDSLSESLIQLRGEVEQLDSEISDLRQEGQLDVQTLKIQQGELAASIEAEQLRSDQIRAQMSGLSGELHKKGFEDTQMKKVVIEAIDRIQTYVTGSIPFQLEKRVDELEALKVKVNKDEITSVKAALRLWSFVEDELRSSTENSVFRQTLKVNGQDKLVEVAKLGSVFLFYKTTSGEYGTLLRDTSGWEFQEIRDSSEEAQVAVLFESLKKQIRTGEFTIPNQLKARL